MEEVSSQSEGGGELTLRGGGERTVRGGGEGTVRRR